MCAPPPPGEAPGVPTAALAAEHRRPTASPFGPSDEIGIFDLATAEAAARVLPRADGGHAFDLAAEDVHEFAFVGACLKIRGRHRQSHPPHRPAAAAEARRPITSNRPTEARA